MAFSVIHSLKRGFQIEQPQKLFPHFDLYKIYVINLLMLILVSLISVFSSKLKIYSSHNLNVSQLSQLIQLSYFIMLNEHSHRWGLVTDYEVMWKHFSLKKHVIRQPSFRVGGSTHCPPPPLPPNFKCLC